MVTSEMSFRMGVNFFTNLRLEDLWQRSCPTWKSKEHVSFWHWASYGSIFNPPSMRTMTNRCSGKQLKVSWADLRVRLRYARSLTDFMFIRAEVVKSAMCIQYERFQWVSQQAEALLEWFFEYNSRNTVHRFMVLFNIANFVMRGKICTSWGILELIMICPYKLINLNQF